MARLVLCVLALCAIGAYADPINRVEKLDIKVLQERQAQLMELYFHIHEPNHFKECQDIASSWSLEEHINNFNNVTAVHNFLLMFKGKYNLPRAVPFSVYESAHTFEATTVFNILFSAKDYETFYKTAVYLRDILNEGLFVYALNIAILYRPDTQGVSVPLIYEVFPSYFNNGEIMNTAQRINTHGHRYVEKYPSTYLWDNNVVIRWNATAWPYYNKDSPLAYYTHDYGLNAYNYHFNLAYPWWLGSDVVPAFLKERRGEVWWYYHKQSLARYYMERLSNGLGEIPEISDVVHDGYHSGLLYHNGIPYPARPNNFHLDQPEFVEVLQSIYEYERRLWEAIDQGYVINKNGEHINIKNWESIEILAHLIEANADSVNRHLYKDFISLWKKILGNNIHHHQQFHKQVVPLVVPSALENPQTSIRDPAFFMIWKRVMRLFEHWQKQLPLYKEEELLLPQVEIEKVEVDKLVTYFEQTYMNVSNHLHMNEHEVKTVSDDVSVLVQHPRLNHKPYNIKVHVKSEVAKTVVVKFLLAPKYDSKGFEIPLHENYENFYQLDLFSYDLQAGDNLIVRESTANLFVSQDWMSSFELYDKVINKQWSPVETTPQFKHFPARLLLPKGRVGGMPFVLFVYIYEYHAPKVQLSEHPQIALGFGSGPRFLTDHPLAFPVNRPLYYWQVENLKNAWFQDVQIYHKYAPEIHVPYVQY